MTANWKPLAQKDVDSHGVCDEYSQLVSRAETVDDVLFLYKRGIDWCLENNSPSVDLLRQYKSDCERNSIFIDRVFNGELLIDEAVYVFHNCQGKIYVDLNLKKHTIPMLYFANGCEIEICRPQADYFSQISVPVYTFGENKITAKPTKDINFWKYDNCKTANR